MTSVQWCWGQMRSDPEGRLYGLMWASRRWPLVFVGVTLSAKGAK